MADETNAHIEQVTINFTRLLDLGKDHQRQVDALQERIDSLCRRVIINGQNVLPAILGLTRNPDELKLLSKTLARLAELVPQLDRLSDEAKVFTLAINDPNRFAGIFGDLPEAPDDWTQILGKDT